MSSVTDPGWAASIGTKASDGQDQVVDPGPQRAGRPQAGVEGALLTGGPVRGPGGGGFWSPARVVGSVNNRGAGTAAPAAGDQDGEPDEHERTTERRDHRRCPMSPAAGPPAGSAATADRKGRQLTGERPQEGVTPDSLLALHAAGYRTVIERLGSGHRPRRGLRPGVRVGPVPRPRAPGGRGRLQRRGRRGGAAGLRAVGSRTVAQMNALALGLRRGAASTGPARPTSSSTSTIPRGTWPSWPGC